ncbi:hypothetical protein, partial [Peptoniphilus sp. DNF00840]|uniref:hypothetical protein n=1 Tax=Peptoniphilus sp. DNF00840 TaxID=1477000 RepID=UPI00079303FF
GVAILFAIHLIIMKSYLNKKFLIFKILSLTSFEFLGWLPLGVVGKGPCQVVEGVGGGPEGDATQAQADQSKGPNPLRIKNRKALLYKTYLNNNLINKYKSVSF